MKKNKQGKESQKASKVLALPYKGVSLTNILFPDEHVISGHLSTFQIICGIAVFLTIFSVYLKTLYPTIGLLDSGDMVSSAYNLGIPHPPGYPIYCLLGKLWLTIIPFSNIAFKMNIFSSLAASIACMMVYFIVLKITPMRKDIVACLPAIVAAGMLAFAPTFWKQAVIAEKYTLNAAFATILIFILLKWQEEAACKQKKVLLYGYLFLFALCLGFSFTHHLQSIFLVPASIYLIMAVNWRMTPRLGWLTYLKIALLFILPLLLYLYLPIRASVNPLTNWGDPDTWEKFINHITAKQYGYYFTSSPIKLMEHLWTHLTNFFPIQFTWYLLWLGIVGCIFLWKTSRRTAIFLCLIVATDILHSIRYDILNIDDYYIPSFAIFAVWIGVAVVHICNWTNRFYCQLPLILTCISVSLPIISLCSHYHQQDKSKHYFAYDSAVNTLNMFKDRAVMFCASDDIGFPAWYLLYVEQMKPETIIIDKAFLQYPWYTELLKQRYPDEFSFSVSQTGYSTTLDDYTLNFIRANILRHSIYLEYQQSLEEEFSLVPTGIFCQIVPKITQDEMEKVLSEMNMNFNLRGVRDKSIYKDWRTNVIFKNYGAAYLQLGSFCGNANLYEQAEKWFQKALELNPDGIDAYLGFGLVMENTNRVSDARKLYQKALKIKPDDPQIQKRLQEVMKCCE
jgi:tetratricopeptide (TPR) repeat protein